MKNSFSQIFIFVFLLVSSVLFGQNFYRSNSIGMVFEQISSLRLDDFDWTVKISTNGKTESRLLYHNGNEVKKLEYVKEGSNLIITEYISDKMVHMKDIENGLIILEKYFKNDGIVEKYEYEWEDRQLYRTLYSENDHLIYEDFLVVDAKGRIQQIRRLYDSGNKQLAGFSYTNNVVTSGWYGKDRDFLLYRYKDGKVVETDTWRNGDLSTTVKFNFSESGKTVIENDILTNKTTVKKYNLSDKVLSEEIRSGNYYSKTVFLYENNLLAQKNISSSGLREKHRYEYDADNSLKMERILRDNMLFKEIFYENEKITMEKIYKNEKLVLLITYNEGEITNEEYIQ